MLFYDIEVFKHYWCVVVVDDEKEIRHVFEDIHSLREFYKENRHQIWVGYNSRQYDAPMLRFIMLELDPYECSQDLIVLGKKWFEFGYYVTQLYKRIPLKNFDCYLLNKGLKKLEGFRGSSIIETSVPFDIDRELTREEKDEVVSYCTHDVLETRKVFYDTKQEFDSHVSLIETFNLPEEFISKTKAQMAATILEAKQSPRFDEWEFTFPDTLKIERYDAVLHWYRNPENHDYKQKLKRDIAGVPHVFAWGGIHGAIPRYQGEGFYVNMDVASYYPALMIEYNYLSRNVADPSKFRKIRDDRLVMKANKDPRQLPYKIVINGTYGAMKDKYNGLYDPLQANNVCIAGQLLLLDLIEKLEDHCDIIQSNTDGVLVKLRDEKDYDKIIGIGQEWSERTRMELEYETVHKVFQKDVNNYIIVDAKGKVKSKGAWTKTWERYEGNSPVPDYIDYDMVILRKAIHAYFVNGIPVEETIHNNKDMIDFQKIVMVSRKYHYGLHGDKPLNERHLRVFASKNESDGGIFKLSVAKNNLNKANDTSPHSFLVNESVVGLSTDDFPQLDKQFYIDMVNDRIKKFVKQN